MGRFYKPSSGPDKNGRLALTVSATDSRVQYEDGKGEMKNLWATGVVVDSAGKPVGRGGDAATRLWRWDLGEGGGVR